MKENEFYCVKCRDHVMCDKNDIHLAVSKTDKRDVYSLKCKCPNCGTNMTKFVKAADVEHLENMYGKAKVMTPKKKSSPKKSRKASSAKKSRKASSNIDIESLIGGLKKSSSRKSRSRKASTKRTRKTSRKSRKASSKIDIKDIIGGLKKNSSPKGRSRKASSKSRSRKASSKRSRKVSSKSRSRKASSKRSRKVSSKSRSRKASSKRSRKSVIRKGAKVHGSYKDGSDIYKDKEGYFIIKFTKAKGVSKKYMKSLSKYI